MSQTEAMDPRRNKADYGQSYQKLYQIETPPCPPLISSNSSPALYSITSSSCFSKNSSLSLPQNSKSIPSFHVHDPGGEKKPKNFRLVVDPSLKPNCKKVVSYNGVIAGVDQPIVLRDPRSRTSKLWSKKEPLDLHLPKFKYDQFSFGSILPKEVSFFNLNNNIDKIFLSNMCKFAGMIDEVHILHHPITKRHLGLGAVIFTSTKAAKLCVEKLNNTSSMGNIMKVAIDTRGLERMKIYEELTNNNKISNSNINKNITNTINNHTNSISNSFKSPVTMNNYNNQPDYISTTPQQNVFASNTTPDHNIISASQNSQQQQQQQQFTPSYLDCGYFSSRTSEHSGADSVGSTSSSSTDPRVKRTPTTCNTTPTTSVNSNSSNFNSNTTNTITYTTNNDQSYSVNNNVTPEAYESPKNSRIKTSLDENQDEYELKNDIHKKKKYEKNNSSDIESTRHSKHNRNSNDDSCDNYDYYKNTHNDEKDTDDYYKYHHDDYSNNHIDKRKDKNFKDLNYKDSQNYSESRHRFDSSDEEEEGGRVEHTGKYYEDISNEDEDEKKYYQYLKSRSYKHNKYNKKHNKHKKQKKKSHKYSEDEEDENYRQERYYKHHRKYKHRHKNKNKYYKNSNIIVIEDDDENDDKMKLKLNNEDEINNKSVLSNNTCLKASSDIANNISSSCIETSLDMRIQALLGHNIVNNTSSHNNPTTSITSNPSNNNYKVTESSCPKETGKYIDNSIKYENSNNISNKKEIGLLKKNKIINNEDKNDYITDIKNDDDEDDDDDDDDDDKMSMSSNDDNNNNITIINKNNNNLNKNTTSNKNLTMNKNNKLSSSAPSSSSTTSSLAVSSSALSSLSFYSSYYSSFYQQQHFNNPFSKYYNQVYNPNYTNNNNNNLLYSTSQTNDHKNNTDNNNKIFNKVLDSVFIELQLVISKDLRRKMVESLAFRVFDQWCHSHSKKSDNQNSKCSTTSSSSTSSVVYNQASKAATASTTQMTITTTTSNKTKAVDSSSLLLTALFNNPMRNHSSFGGAGGLLGLRGCMPKMPSFRKKYRPPTPPTSNDKDSDEEEEEKKQGSVSPSSSDNEKDDEGSVSGATAIPSNDEEDEDERRETEKEVEKKDKDKLRRNIIVSSNDEENEGEDDNIISGTGYEEDVEDRESEEEEEEQKEEEEDDDEEYQPTATEWKSIKRNRDDYDEEDYDSYSEIEEKVKKRKIDSSLITNQTSFSPQPTFHSSSCRLFFPSDTTKPSHPKNFQVSQSLQDYMHKDKQRHQQSQFNLDSNYCDNVNDNNFIPKNLRELQRLQCHLTPSYLSFHNNKSKIYHQKKQQFKSQQMKFEPREFPLEAFILESFLQVGLDSEDIRYLNSSYDQLLQTEYSQIYWLNDTHWCPHPPTYTHPTVSSQRKRKRASEFCEDYFSYHKSGSARTEGFYKISHIEKKMYLQHARGLSTNKETSIETEVAMATTNQNVGGNNKKKIQQQSREARSESRKWQSLLASMGEDPGELLKFNQLKFRKKQLKFARSSIHDWGLFALERIQEGEMVIEYVGQLVRQSVADLREKRYEKDGIGSSYLFRINSENIVDATKHGNLSRFINHCCNPNCYAKIVSVESQKKIVIYSRRDIEANEEITYDYKFPLEENKIPCLCGAQGCRGTLN